jgi:hypothetical protein
VFKPPTTVIVVLFVSVRLAVHYSDVRRVWAVFVNVLLSAATTLETSGEDVMSEAFTLRILRTMKRLITRHSPGVGLNKVKYSDLLHSIRV